MAGLCLIASSSDFIFSYPPIMHAITSQQCFHYTRGIYCEHKAFRYPRGKFFFFLRCYHCGALIRVLCKMSFKASLEKCLGLVREVKAGEGRYVCYTNYSEPDQHLIVG